MEKRSRIRRTISIVTLVLIGLLVTGGAAFYAWASGGPAPAPEALAALQSDDQVRVTTDGWLVFEPATGAATTGLVFYPGGRVAAAAYSPPAREIASQGYLVVIPSMPLNLAVFDSGAAGEVMAAFPEIRCWSVGGHSLGGAMAARYTNRNRDQVEGLVLWASYPAQGDDLSDSGLAAVSIYGTLDGLADPETVRAAAGLLPPDTTWVTIEGGNHAQFGWYGPQDGDNPATISPQEQMDQVVAGTLEGLAQVDNCGQTTAER